MKRIKIKRNTNRKMACNKITNKFIRLKNKNQNQKRENQMKEKKPKKRVVRRKIKIEIKNTKR